MKIFIIIFISLFITKGYANNMEISGIDISQFNEGFKPQDSFYDYVNHNWLSETEIPDDQIGWGSYMTLREESLQNQNTFNKVSQFSNIAWPMVILHFFDGFRCKAFVFNVICSAKL